MRQNGRPGCRYRDLPAKSNARQICPTKQTAIETAPRRRKRANRTGPSVSQSVCVKNQAPHPTKNHHSIHREEQQKPPAKSQPRSAITPTTTSPAPDRHNTVVRPTRSQRKYARPFHPRNEIPRSTIVRRTKRPKPNRSAATEIQRHRSPHDPAADQRSTITNAKFSHPLTSPRYRRKENGPVTNGKATSLPTCGHPLQLAHRTAVAIANVRSHHHTRGTTAAP